MISVVLGGSFTLTMMAVGLFSPCIRLSNRPLGRAAAAGRCECCVI